MPSVAHHAEVVGEARNERGVIAEHYHALQSLGLVERARSSRAPEPQARLLRTVLQCCDLALYNMADLLRTPSVGKLQWVHGFHRVMLSLTGVSSRFTAATRRNGPHVRPSDSPAF